MSGKTILVSTMVPIENANAKPAMSPAGSPPAFLPVKKSSSVVPSTAATDGKRAENSLAPKTA
jgi:hypothetical protein